MAGHADDGLRRLGVGWSSDIENLSAASTRFAKSAVHAQGEDRAARRLQGPFFPREKGARAGNDNKEWFT